MQRSACLVVSALSLVGCGAQRAPAPASTPTYPVTSELDGYTPETAWHACFDTRSDYRRVAEYRCADGSMPLAGNVSAGGAARRGNIGAGPDGHVLDRYEVSCPEGLVVLYVDMYHCEEEAGDLSEAEIQRAMADLEIYLRAPEDSSVVVVNRAHRALEQLGIDVPECGELLQLLIPPEDQLPSWRVIANVYFGAAIDELYQHRSAFAPGADPTVAARVEDNAQQAAALVMVRHYRRMVAAGARDLQHPQLERLGAIPEAQLAEEVSARIGVCRLARTASGTQTEPQN